MAAMFAAITANGLSTRPLRPRSSATVYGFEASHARWKPPNPLIATIYPSRNKRRALRMAEVRISMLEMRGSVVGNWECVSRNSTNGPHSGQAIGWAWKRLFNGSVYSVQQCSHMGKSAIVVLGRSYGISLIMVNRGPQWVQLM